MNFNLFKSKIETRYYILSDELYLKYCNDGGLSIVDELSKLKSWDSAEQAAAYLVSNKENVSSSLCNILKVTKTVKNDSLYYMIALLIIMALLVTFSVFSD